MDQPARWPWESPPHSCRIRKVMSVSVRKKGRGRKRHTILKGAKKRTHPAQQEEAAASPATTTQKQEELKERVAEVVAATMMGVIKKMTHPDAPLMFQPQRGPAVSAESSPDSCDSEATEVLVYAAVSPPIGADTSEYRTRRDKIHVTRPMGKRQREEWSAHASVRTPDPKGISAHTVVNPPHAYDHSHTPRATGTQSCVFTYGRKRCRQCTFNIVRQEPSRGTFNWQEMEVTMCEHGEIAPLLNRLQAECDRAPAVIKRPTWTPEQTSMQ